MGIPYSKQINAAFTELSDAYTQVTPLVAAAYEVLETTKNISLLLLALSIFSTITLSITLIVSIGILISVNPDLESERRELVTPVVRWTLGWVAWGVRWGRVLGIVGVVVGLLVVWGGVRVTMVRGGEGVHEGLEMEGKGGIYGGEEVLVEEGEGEQEGTEGDADGKEEVEEEKKEDEEEAIAQAEEKAEKELKDKK